MSQEQLVIILEKLISPRAPEVKQLLPDAVDAANAAHPANALLEPMP